MLGDDGERWSKIQQHIGYATKYARKVNKICNCIILTKMNQVENQTIQIHFWYHHATKVLFWTPGILSTRYVMNNIPSTLV